MLFGAVVGAGCKLGQPGVLIFSSPQRRFGHRIYASILNYVGQNAFGESEKKLLTAKDAKAMPRTRRNALLCDLGVLGGKCLLHGVAMPSRVSRRLHGPRTH